MVVPPQLLQRGTSVNKVTLPSTDTVCSVLKRLLGPPVTSGALTSK